MVPVVVFGWAFWAWWEKRKERRRLARGDPAPTTDPTGWRHELGLPVAQSSKDALRLRELERHSYEAIRHRSDQPDDSGAGHG